MSEDEKPTGAYDRYSGEMTPHPGPATPVSHDGAGDRGEPAREEDGAVSGSGSGAGGGGADEDYDNDPVGGGGSVQTRKD